jgi:hypothetical protein
MKVVDGWEALQHSTTAPEAKTASASTPSQHGSYSTVGYVV